MGICLSRGARAWAAPQAAACQQLRLARHQWYAFAAFLSSALSSPTVCRYRGHGHHLYKPVSSYDPHVRLPAAGPGRTRRRYRRPQPGHDAAAPAGAF
jgi:hypothetical protein